MSQKPKEKTDHNLLCYQQAYELFINTELLHLPEELTKFPRAFHIHAQVYHQNEH